jgi:hypothetical protein
MIAWTWWWTGARSPECSPMIPTRCTSITKTNRHARAYLITEPVNKMGDPKIKQLKPYSPKNKILSGSEKARRRRPKAVRNQKFWEIPRQAHGVGARGRVGVRRHREVFFRCGLGGTSGYKEWVDSGWVRKVIRFWQKHSLNCDFYGRSTFLVIT